ncbi:MAG: HEAT repeat domain-containing protein [Planctomycetota bacterium]
MDPRTAATGVALLLAVSVGFVGGRLSAPDLRAEAAPPRGSLGAPATAGAPRVAAAHDDGHGHAHAPARVAPDATPSALPSELGEEEPEAPLDLEPLFDAARRAQADPEDHGVHEEASDRAGEVLERLLADPHAVTQALEALARSTDPAELDALAAVLGQVRDPEVEEAALNLAQRAPDPARRAAAFDILDAFDTPAARDLALGALSRERDVTVRRAALRAVAEPDGDSVDDAAPVVQSLTRLLREDADPELRRRSAMLLGRWARDEAELDPVLRALADPDPVVRGGAAFALEIAQRRSPRVIGALSELLANPQTDVDTAENAWRALGSLAPLPPQAYQVWTAYREERTASGEVR